MNPLNNICFNTYQKMSDVVEILVQPKDDKQIIAKNNIYELIPC